MFDRSFLIGRIVHLINRKRAVLKSLKDYGASMPEAHLKHKTKDMLPAIEAAIEKIKNNPKEYGICEGCGKQIDEARILVLPEAVLCVQCQSRKEDAYA